MNGEIKEWVKKDFATLCLNSKRLERRFKMAISDLSEQPEKSIWLASGSRANAKAVYRMLSNEKLNEESILSAHRDSLSVPEDGQILLAVQDTMSVNYETHLKTFGMGYNCEQTLGLNIHSCIAIHPEGVPRGLLAQSAITREKPKTQATHQEKRMRPIEAKESCRWLETMKKAAENAPKGAKLIHIADREGDIYELYALAQETGQRFIIRAVHDRIDEERKHIMSELSKEPVAGKTMVTISRSGKRKERQAFLSVRYKEFNVKIPQIREKSETLPKMLRMTLVGLREENPPSGVEGISWLLMTNLEIRNASDAIQAAEYYRQRWKIERFHYVLKSGCKIEEIQQRSVEKIEYMILMYSIISIHIMQITMMARSYPETPCSLVFDENEWKILYRAANMVKWAPEEPYSMLEAVNFIAILGGRHGAKSDGPPGLESVWLGLHCLHLLCAYREFLQSVGHG